MKENIQSVDSASSAGLRHYRIRPFGDSITAGYGWGTGCPRPWPPPPALPPQDCPPAADGGGYRSFLVGSPPNKSPLLMVGHRHDNSPSWMWQLGQQNHDGYSGYTIPQMVPIAGLSLAADIILVHAGTNDILFGGATGASAAASLKTLLVTLLTNELQAKVLVAQIVPAFGTYRDKDPIIQDYNSRIPGVVAKFASWQRILRVVDLYSGMQSMDYSDTVHPNYQGYKKMANGWRNAINTLPAAALPADAHLQGTASDPAILKWLESPA
jgi:hypothetical protein